MKTLTQHEIENVDGAWLAPLGQAVLIGLGIFAGASHIDTASKKYNGWGHDIGEAAYNATHSDANILGQMTFTADDFSNSRRLI